MGGWGWGSVMRKACSPQNNLKKWQRKSGLATSGKKVTQTRLNSRLGETYPYDPSNALHLMWLLIETQQPGTIFYWYDYIFQIKGWQNDQTMLETDVWYKSPLLGSSLLLCTRQGDISESGMAEILWRFFWHTRPRLSVWRKYFWNFLSWNMFTLYVVILVMFFPP